MDWGCRDAPCGYQLGRVHWHVGMPLVGIQVFKRYAPSPNAVVLMRIVVFETPPTLGRRKTAIQMEQ